jgi:7,8-dihydropterin-6-yl-methyl-4-(beta-D-ribofuranosyl)aminobenzene 5'-phosphate synthase
MKRLDVQRIGVSHCTGPVASSLLAAELGDRFFFNHAGTCTELEL